MNLDGLSDDEMDRLAGLTGLGWTGSLLLYLAAVIGTGNGVVTKLVANPRGLLYVGAVLFVLTAGLDHLVTHAGSEG
ncbi:hypothetical protein [Halorientalis marina]|jgi:hypothetical protein|uniref:hypothetical protein n=1 Tax=Halorientalis marina TaxID=2931976 RepID=UPI001FF46505|nr:hypothetical protein [Halorientalis marina]